MLRLCDFVSQPGCTTLVIAYAFLVLSTYAVLLVVLVVQYYACNESTNNRNNGGIGGYVLRMSITEKEMFQWIELIVIKYFPPVGFIDCPYVCNMSKISSACRGIFWNRWLLLVSDLYQKNSATTQKIALLNLSMPTPYVVRSTAL
jgi:hypothetical protein